MTQLKITEKYESVASVVYYVANIDSSNFNNSDLIYLSEHHHTTAFYLSQAVLCKATTTLHNIPITSTQAKIPPRRKPVYYCLN